MLFLSSFICLLLTGVRGLPQGNPVASAITVAGDDLPAGPDEGLPAGPDQGQPAGPDQGQPAGVVDTMTVEDMKNAFPPRDPADAQNWYGTSLFGFK
jgi:hypothetical protein